jgi:DNA anti-recombination protein RmuC
MQKLAQQQQLIQKSLEQLNQEAKISGQSKKLPADLDNILKKMQEVITDMQGEKLDDNLIQKQENILSKLLDAQRSINERDYEKERESRSGETVLRESPSEMDLTNPNSLNKIRDELNKAVKEGYLRDYEDLIRKYYENLQKENNNIQN